MKRLLVVPQLSNYDTHGKWCLECDSGWQMCINRIRVMLRLVPDLYVDIMGPMTSDRDDPDRGGQLITDPLELNSDLFTGYGDRLRYVPFWIEPNALATRYNFDMEEMSWSLFLESHKSDHSLRYDAVYVNDPMHLRNFKALFLLKAGYQPKFFVHSHFIDNPECPKFPTDASLWLGQCEAAIKADYNFWQCESAMNVFFESMSKWFNANIVDKVRAKSEPWDDGYSIEEITSSVDMKNIRFDIELFHKIVTDKTVLFVPNRIGGRGRSSDYTNCGRFMFDVLPELRKIRQDFVVLAGNPSQKFSNDELEQECSQNGYVNLVPDSFTRDEFKFVAKNSHIVVGLYNDDRYGGTVARECIELGSMPLWLDVNEYSSIAREARINHWLARPDLSDLVKTASDLIDIRRASPEIVSVRLEYLRHVVRKRCSFESTTPQALRVMGFLK